MGEHKHTPGPWQWVPSDEYGYSVLWNPNTRAEVINASGRNDGDSPITWMGEEMSDADARLIANAPDLLSIVRRWSAIDGGAWNVQRYATERAELMADTRAAISRATTPTPSHGLSTGRGE